MTYVCMNVITANAVANRECTFLQKKKALCRYRFQVAMYERVISPWHIWLYCRCIAKTHWFWVICAYTAVFLGSICLMTKPRIVWNCLRNGIDLGAGNTYKYVYSMKRERERILDFIATTCRMEGKVINKRLFKQLTNELRLLRGRFHQANEWRDIFGNLIIAHRFRVAPQDVMTFESYSSLLRCATKMHENIVITED